MRPIPRCDATISAISKEGTEQLAFDIMKQLEIDRELEREQEEQQDPAAQHTTASDAEKEAT